MSILIKGIDLPKVYGPAILTVYECIDGQTIPREYKLFATQMQAIPPHGRLIDADALPHYTGYALSANEVAKAVEAAPTIIEAEEGENDERTD